jgi:hypothetical protein
MHQPGVDRIGHHVRQFLEHRSRGLDDGVQPARAARIDHRPALSPFQRPPWRPDASATWDDGVRFAALGGWHLGGWSYAGRVQPVIDLAPGAEREPLARLLAELVQSNVRALPQRRAFERLRGSVAVIADDTGSELTLRFDLGRLTVHEGVLGVPDVTVRGLSEELVALAKLPYRSRFPLPWPRRQEPEGVDALKSTLAALGARRLKIYGLARHPRFVARLLRLLARQRRLVLAGTGRLVYGSSRLIRHRLRFLLQEVDLPLGDTVVGRSSSCQITIEDPLISRQHARFRVHADGVTVEDLGSRNGVKVNGVLAVGAARLVDGDRVRIGGQDFVLVGAPEGRSEAISTGFMCACAECGHTYGEELERCPRCGSVHRVDENTLSGFTTQTSRAWMLELLVELVEKAEHLERYADVERVLVRSRAQLELKLASGETLSQALIERLALAALRAAARSRLRDWRDWTTRLYGSLGATPPDAVRRALDEGR